MKILFSYKSGCREANKSTGSLVTLKEMNLTGPSGRSIAMIGNDLADMTADGDWMLERWGTHGTMVTTSVGEILHQLSGEDMWMWVDANGSPITSNLLKLAKETRDREYLVRRDGYRRERGEPPVWAGTVAKFASLQFDLKSQPLGERARRVRIVWD